MSKNPLPKIIDAATEWKIADAAKLGNHKLVLALLDNISDNKFDSTYIKGAIDNYRKCDNQITYKNGIRLLTIAGYVSEHKMDQFFDKEDPMRGFVESCLEDRKAFFEGADAAKIFQKCLTTFSDNSHFFETDAVAKEAQITPDQATKAQFTENLAELTAGKTTVTI